MRSNLLTASLLAWVWFASSAAGQETPAPSGSDLTETGRKLSNPLSDVWALFSRFELTFSDRDISLGDSKVRGRMLFQPILPMPLYGQGPDR
jgi:hypothetical protein